MISFVPLKHFLAGTVVQEVQVFVLVEDHPDSAGVVSVGSVEGGSSVKLVLGHLEEQTSVG